MTAPDQASITLVVDEEKNRVVFAHAGKDFVDVMVSFLTLPLGTIARLVAKESNMKKVSVGCLSSLYESVANLDVKHFWTETCKEMLLLPRNSMESYCQSLKLNIDDTESIKYFICEDSGCTRRRESGCLLLSTFRDKRCHCGKLMNREISPQSGMMTYDEGFVLDMATFIIYDDLKLKPYNSAVSVLTVIQDYHATKEITVNVTKEEMVDLLKCSLLSKTPLTDFFLRKTEFPQCAQPQPTKQLVINFDPSKADVGVVAISLKVFLRKSNSKILFALAEQDFVDLLFSFLTFPLGGVEQMLNGNSGLGSIDNLYKSMLDLDGNEYMRSLDIKDKFFNYRLAHQFKIKSQIYPIKEIHPSYYSCFICREIIGKPTIYFKDANDSFSNTKGVFASLNYLEPQASTGDAYRKCGGIGFVKKPLMYMVKDDLVVTPAGPFSTITFLTKSGIPQEDLEERRTISIGKAEGLNILKASLISSSALTNGLTQFLKPIKEENKPIKKQKFSYY
ncbi:hypothetical protein RIF29_30387 [Crotalaria pallida]|uniref:DUF674 family protein n=1 Tax=Crotalaria pallida TaxID=3830 RepID=A0AAN9EI80_CROPI